MVRRGLALVLLLLAPALATGAPDGCTDYLNGLARACNRTPDGSGGVSYATPVAFAYASGSQAGAGSLVGGAAAWSLDRVTVAVYGNAFVAFDAVVLEATTLDATGDGRSDALVLDLSYRHRGFPWDDRWGATLSGETDRKDAPRERARLVANGPYSSADLDSATTRLRVVALGYPVVLLP